ncbi:MAG: WD40/YVTN/BNR-like repeat-containing protein, partial [Blastocatellia bacterium]
MEWFRKQRAYPFASVPADARRKAWLTIKKSNGALSPQDAGMGWSPVGPAPTDSGLPMGLSSGRINTIAISPADPNVLLIGSSAGGIWRSNDGGNTFIPVSDDQVDLEVGSIAFSQSDPNIVYAGMGDAFGGLLGTGVLKSVDAGQTWTRIDGGSVGQGMINALRVDPTNPNLVYSSHFDMLDETSGMLFGAGFEKSTDGGASWNRTLPGLPTDLAIDPLEPKKLYLAMVGVFDGSGRPPGIYQSLDSGNTWNLIRPFSFANGVSTAKIALAPSDPRTIYAYYGGFNPGLQVLFEVSTDGGATWASKDVSQVDSGQFGYNTYIGVDPADPGTVYLGSRDVYKTTDAGSTWKNLTVNFVPSPTNPGSWNFQPGQATSHSDQHAVAISPKNSNQVFISNDGG